MAEGQSGQGVGPDRRPGQRGAHLHAVFPECHRHPIQYVPYRGAAPVMQDLIANQVDLSCDLAGQTAAAIPRRQVQGVRGDEQRALVAPPPTCRPWTKPARPVYISVPGTACGRRRTRQPVIVARLNAAVVAAFADPCHAKALQGVGMEAPPRESDARGAVAWHKAEIEKWWPMIQSRRLKVNEDGEGGQDHEACVGSPSRLAAPLGAQAQTFPAKPVTLIVPFPAGGGSDILARLSSRRMKPRSASR